MLLFGVVLDLFIDRGIAFGRFFPFLFGRNAFWKSFLQELVTPLLCVSVLIFRLLISWATRHMSIASASLRPSVVQYI